MSRKKKTVSVLYGAVTTGGIWQFLKLEDTILTVDLDVYYLSEIDKILGILQEIFENCKT